MTTVFSLDRPNPVITIDVLGSPAPKGSGRAMLIAGKARHVPSGSSANQKQLRSWDVNVRDAARQAIGPVAAPPFIETPLHVEILFRMARPGGHWGKKGLKPSAARFPAGKPDLDKLVRSTLDSLSGIAFDDDSRIVQLTVAKLYATPGQEGARITLREMAW